MSGVSSQASQKAFSEIIGSIDKLMKEEAQLKL